MTNNNQNSSCDRAEQLVAFLYGEIEEAVKPAFEAHLRECHSCADELAGFVTVRSSIQEWHTEDFARLPTPAFELLPAAAAKEPSDSGNWFDKIRGFFAFSPGLMTASSAAAVLLLFAAFFWFTTDFLKNTEFASDKSPIIKEEVPLTAQVTPDTNLMSDTGENKENLVDPAARPTPTQKENHAAKEVSASEARVIQSGVRNAAPNKVKKSVSAFNPVRNNNKKLPKTAAGKNNVPSLAIDDDQDRSLRLSDILEEVSMK